MGAMPSPEQSRLYAGLLPAIELSVETPVCAADLENERSAKDEPASPEGALRSLARAVITFYIGVAATLAWQSYGDEARQIIASLSPQLSWLAPQAAAAPAVPDANEEITRSVDRIVAANQEQIALSVDRIVAASQEQIARSVAQLAADQEQMAREIIRLQAISQYGLYKIADPPPRPAASPALRPVTRPVR
jgi:hypothetical protein